MTTRSKLKIFVGAACIILCMVIILGLNSRKLLVYACNNKQYTMVKLIIASNKRLLNAYIGPDWRLIDYAILDNDITLLSYLLTQGSDPNLATFGGFLPIQHAIETRNLEAVKCLVMFNADPEIIYTNNSSLTPLHHAVLAGNIDIVNYLLHSGCNVDINTVGGTPLFFAQDKSMAELLISHGANIEARNDFDSTPLIRQSARDDKIELIQLLISNHANVNAKSVHGWTALHVAANEHIARILVEHGADVSAKTANGLLPIDTAKSSRRDSTYNYLKTIAQ